MTNQPAYPVDDVSLGSMIRWNTRYRGDHPAFVCGDRSVSYAELSARANQLVHALAARGVGAGDRVATFLPNCIEYAEVYIAAAKAGLVITPLNYMLTEREVEYIVSDSGAKALITAPAKRPVVDALRAAGSISITDELILETGDGGGYDALLAGASTEEPPQIPATEPFFQGYTSGTTGLPKGCLQTQLAFVDHFKKSLYHFDHRHDDVMLIGGPMFHEAPALFSLAQLFYGGTVVVLPAFSPDAAMSAIEDHRCTIMGFAVPTMLDAMNSIPPTHDVSSLRQIVCGGAALLGPTIQATLDRFPEADLYEFYGATELGVMTTINHRGSSKTGSVGPPFPGIGIAILDNQDRVQPVGGRGQIYITPIMMEGYHNKPDKTAEDTRVVDGVEWFTVGDVGYLDDDGYLYIVDRKKHMIISGGENVYPIEVESVLIEHPKIKDVAVIGLPDERWGEAVTAVVVGTAGEVTVEEIREYAAGKLAAFKTPKRVIMVDTLPRTASGKILKHILRSEHEPTPPS